MGIGKQIKYFRQRKSVRQEDLAEYLGVSCQAVSKWETESSLPDIMLLPRLAVYFGVAIDDFFRISEDDQLTRIENALMASNRLDECTFQSYEEFLCGLTDDRERKTKAHLLLSALYNHRAHSDHQAAAEQARQALALNPEEDMGWVYLIEAHEACCGDEWWDNHFDLISYCMDFLKTHPHHFRCLYALIENLLADKRYLDAIPYVEELGRMPGRDYQAEIYRGDIAQGMGDASKAMACWNRAVENHPDVWQAYCNRADRMKKLGRYEEALKDYDHCFLMQKPPRITDGLFSRAQLYEQLGQYDQAIAERRRIIQVLQEDFCLPEEYGLNEINDQKRQIERLQQLADHNP